MKESWLYVACAKPFASSATQKDGPDVAAAQTSGARIHRSTAAKGSMASAPTRETW